ncbi:hypothetical protein W97_03282 [Coniosporium apollinis CBS 100218]|uniref:Protein BZZ1 n=1 Tax=Coniosporium apollinis (strain CBS 100218) TaxID=1168221 RepID=R7YQ81_CONA1|nr:uncharacterized protein W97_03282 [Coniosporium apollinis CBS 100218]EON64052.1 hypothetical protein W97_03282 [Coniosporium apollinis CBS 100218]
MAELDIAPKFGAELKDGYKVVNAWVSGGIAWLDDIQQFYRERSAIEKEYSAKLNALAKKYFEKKARKSSSLSVGDTPTVTPGSLESASMTTWNVQLTTLESRAAEHDQFGSQLISNLADPLKQLASRYEDLRKCHADYAAKLEKERDSSYGELKKMKGKYDSSCQEVESRRKKTESSFDHSRTKAQNVLVQQMAEMNNVKNSYLISINVTNVQKEKYYHEYVPELLDSLQDLSETRVAKLNSIWMAAAQIETATLARSTEFLKHLASEIPRNNPVLDSMMFLRHNIADWREPADFAFEPSPVYYDNDAMVTDEPAKNFLRNYLTKSKGLLGEYRRELETRRREVENAKRVRKAIREGKDKRDEVEVVRAIFSLQENAHEAERQKVTAEVEVSTITSAVGDVSIGARNHNFKSQTFKIPTNCDYCGDRIWGLSAKGFDCRDCGYTCHSKCEMKVPADCPGEQTKEERKALKAQRQSSAQKAAPTNGAATDAHSSKPLISRSDTVNSMNTLSSGYSATAQRSISGTAATPPVEEPQPERTSTIKASPSRRSRILAPPPTSYIKDSSDGAAETRTAQPRGRMTYPYQANGEGEISVSEGSNVVIVEPDDGSGWLRVTSGSSTGLVPASYVELAPTANSTPPPSAHATRPHSTYSNNSSVSLAGSHVSASGASSSGGTLKKKGPAVAPKRGAKKLKYVEALYEYEARSEAEHSMKEGERFVLISPDAGDGWADVEKGGRVASVPANYVQEV